MENLTYLKLFFVFVLLEATPLTKPYPPGSGKWCFDNRVCLEHECCMPVFESDGRLGRGAAPPGKCFLKTQQFEDMCFMSKRVTPTRKCHDGNDCVDNECCTTWIQGPIIGKREIFEGVCEKLGHHGSDCYPDDHKNGTNGKPDGIVASCPCDKPFTCLNIDSTDHHGSLGVCV